MMTSTDFIEDKKGACVMQKLWHSSIGISLLASLVLFLLVSQSLPPQKGVSAFSGLPVQDAVQASLLQPVDLAVLSWPEQLDAVRYDVTISGPAGQKTLAAYSNQVMIDWQALRQGQPEDALSFRIQAFDLHGKPIGAASAPQPLLESIQLMQRNAPLPRKAVQDTNGSLLLYPVYAYTGNPGAVQYEVEVTDHWPENLDGIAPSRYRVFAKTSNLTDVYDEQPRIGTYYWRVRGMDSLGQPVGEWSLPQSFSTQPDPVIRVGIFGDSISHGGGHLSFSPVDFAYSYSHYLDFPTVNLSESGDTSAMMRQRFEDDVLPFHLQYLLIMGGTNSLRAGVPADEVIADLKAIGEKAKEHGITPIYLTLPPINPDNIETAFDEPTDGNWQASFQKVNQFIRSQRHIDVAAPFENDSVLPTSLALDGLHGDWQMKQMMAGTINHAMPFLAEGEGHHE